jgi:hypothetical protein
LEVSSGGVYRSFLSYSTERSCRRFLQALQEEVLIDWELFAVFTDSGTLMVRSSVQAVLMDLDSWAFSERTGFPMPKGQRTSIVPWGGVLKNPLVNMGIGNIDHKKLINILEKDLDAWETAKAATKSAAGPSVDPKMLKEVSAALHKVFTTVKTDTLDIGGLAGMYTAQEGGDYEENKATIRSVLNHPSVHTVFSMGLGGAPKVSRLQTATGKKTGAEPQSRARKAKGSSS